MLRDAARRGFRGYVDFSGRAGRGEYLGWLLFVALAFGGLGVVLAGMWFLVVIAASDPASPLADVVMLAFQGLMLGAVLLLLVLAPPTLAYAARRLRGAGLSRWWLVPMAFVAALAWVLSVNDRLPGDALAFGLVAALLWTLPGLLPLDSAFSASHLAQAALPRCLAACALYAGVLAAWGLLRARPPFLGNDGADLLVLLGWGLGFPFAAGLWLRTLLWAPIAGAAALLVVLAVPLLRDQPGAFLSAAVVVIAFAGATVGAIVVGLTRRRDRS